MPRQRRVHVPGGIFHVTLRGNHRQPIFFCDQDFTLLGELLQAVVDRYDIRVHAYCWMPNHLHLAVQAGEHSLGRPMQVLASTFARRVQRRLATTGHLFERRYFASLVDTNRYLLALVRYIHENPVRANIVARPEQYRWSSHSAYLGEARVAWLTTEAITNRLGDTASLARSAYSALMNERTPAEDLVYFRSGMRLPREQLQVEPIANPRIDREVQRDAIRLIIADECRRFGIDNHALTDPGHDRRQVLVRAVIVWRAVKSRIATISELSPILGRSPASLAEGVTRVRRRHPELFQET